MDLGRIAITAWVFNDQSTTRPLHFQCPWVRTALSVSTLCSSGYGTEAQQRATAASTSLGEFERDHYLMPLTSMILGFELSSTKNHCCQPYYLHSDYRYQPRKPSEKSKCMTKTKLAELAAKAQESNSIDSDVVQPLPDDFDPLEILNEHLGNHSTSQFSVNHFGQVPQQQPSTLRATMEQNALAFEFGTDNFKRSMTRTHRCRPFTPQSRPLPLSRRPTVTSLRRTTSKHFHESGSTAPAPTTPSKPFRTKSLTATRRCRLTSMVTAMDSWYNQQAARSMPSLPSDHKAEVAHRPSSARLNNFVDSEAYESNSDVTYACLLYTSPSPRDGLLSRMPSSA